MKQEKNVLINKTNENKKKKKMSEREIMKSNFLKNNVNLLRTLLIKDDF